MQKRNYLMIILSLMIFTIIVTGCSPDENEKALKDDKGNIVALDNKEKPTLLFLFTGNSWDYCKSQLVELQKNKELFAGFPGDIYALSADSVEHHKELKAELGLDYPILSDKYLQMIEKADLKDPSGPKSLRGFVILDKKGNIIESRQFDPFGDEAANIISYAAEKLQQ